MVAFRQTSYLRSCPYRTVSSTNREHSVTSHATSCESPSDVTRDKVRPLPSPINCTPSIPPRYHLRDLNTGSHHVPGVRVVFSRMTIRSTGVTDIRCAARVGTINGLWLFAPAPTAARNTPTTMAIVTGEAVEVRAEPRAAVIRANKWSAGWTGWLAAHMAGEAGGWTAWVNSRQRYRIV